MKIGKLFAGLSIILFFFIPALAGAAPSVLNNPTVSARSYLPGDFVHVVVEAPVDTAQITATMPDGTTASLIQDRRTNVWRGIWQVPVDFKKGTYSASLTAVDVQGNVFNGQTDSFDIGELALITLVGKPTSEVAAAPKPALREIITAEAAPATAVGQEELLSLIKKIVTPAEVTPPPALTVDTKNLLVARNLAAGKEDVRQGKFSEAAAFFRVVLYLAPDEKEAGALLADTEQKIAQLKLLQEEGRRRLYLIGGAIVLGIVLILAVLLGVLFRALPKGAPAEKPAKPSSDQEKQENWLKKFGWKNNPFLTDVLKQLFAGGGSLNPDGLRNFIKTRIEEAGGSGLEPFTDSALEKVYSLSKGDPGTALKICDWSVAQAIRHDLFAITAEVVRQYEMIGLKKILIADDEEIIRSSLEAILKRGGGYETDFAVDGEEAVKKIKANLYGAVLLDLEMPKLDGYEVLKQVRGSYPELPVIFVTGKGTPQQTLESMAKYNLSGYIEKPFTPEKILDIIARAIKK